jgi:DNA-binding CsgD family transcriptional regulator
MTWRSIREADLLECLSIEPRYIGGEIVGRDTAIAIWKDLIRSRSFNSCVIESASHPGRIAGFGASVFVTPEFATREIENPQPELNSRLIASVAHGASVVRREDDLYNAAAEAPLDLLVLGGIWLPEGLSLEELHEVQMLLAFSFVDLHAGYRLSRIFSEAVTPAQIEYSQSSGVWRMRQQFADIARALFVLTRADAVAVSGSIAISLFQYQEPVLGLRDSERQFLAEALSLRSDKELAARMNLSQATVKKRWQSLFERIADIHPALLPGEGGERLNLTRGPQKRHHILAFVQSHPQELQPYCWRSTK